jgi:hypothetical protein
MSHPQIRARLNFLAVNLSHNCCKSPPVSFVLGEVLGNVVKVPAVLTVLEFPDPCIEDTLACKKGGQDILKPGLPVKFVDVIVEHE